MFIQYVNGMVRSSKIPHFIAILLRILHMLHLADFKTAETLILSGHLLYRSFI